MTDETEDHISDLFDDETGDIGTEPEAKAEVKAEEEAVSTGEQKTEPPSDQKPKSVPIAALLDERRKAQQYKEEVEQLRKQIPQPDEAPDPYEDLDAYKEWVRNEAIREINEAKQAEQAELIEQSRSEMMEKYEDYTDMEKVFSVLNAYDPTLADEMIKDPRSAAKFAYDKGKEYIDSLKGTPEEISKEVSELSEAEKRLKSAVTAPSLASATAQASNSTPVEVEEDLDTMFGDQAY